MISGITGYGAMAIQNGMERMDQAARDIATQSVSASKAVDDQPDARRNSADLVRPLIDQNQAMYQAQAGAVVMRTANNNMGTLLNMFA